MTSLFKLALVSIIKLSLILFYLIMISILDLDCDNTVQVFFINNRMLVLLFLLFINTKAFEELYEKNYE